MIPIIHHDDYRISLSRKGAATVSKYAALYDYLIDHGVIYPSWTISPAVISRENLLRVHSDDYVESVFTLSLDDAALRRIGLARIPELVSRPRRSTGGTLLAARYALSEGIACNLAGGSHHAHRSFGSGFCVFNDVAVAAQTLLDHQEIKQVMVIDLDVHQGDGTAAIFTDNAGVYTFSAHCGRNFPVRKMISNHDLVFSEGTEDDAYLSALEAIIPSLLSQVKPDLVFYLAGVDVHKDDKLGYLALSDSGLRAREHYILKTLCERSIPVVTVMGGGYGDDRHEVARRHAMVVEEAASIFA